MKDELWELAPVASGPLMAADLDDKCFASANIRWRDAGLCVRVVRGQKMTQYEELMDEFAAALQFPYYFGENWAAFQECLEDMDWLSGGKGIVIAITHASEVLSKEPCADLETLVESFNRAAGVYAQPVTDGEWWHRPAIPFHVILQNETGVSSDLDPWRRAGAVFASLPT